MSRSRRRPAAGIACLALALAMLATPQLARGAADWTITRSPSSVQALSTATFSLVATNPGYKKGATQLGCVTVKVPTAFTVTSASVTSASGHTWTAAVAPNGSGTTVTVQATGNSQRLSAQKVQSVSFSVTATAGAVPGAYQWTANAFTVFDCTGPYGQQVSMTVTIGTPINLPPVAAADSYSEAEDTALAVAAPGVLGNDLDPDGDPLAATLVSGPSHGTLSLAANGSFTYKPSAEYSGPDSFTYRAGDGAANSASTLVTLAVTPVNDAPVAVADGYTLNEDSSLSRAAPGVLANDSDKDGPALIAALMAGPSHGSLSLLANGSFTYRPAGGFAGTDSFTYRASDGIASSAATTVTLRIVAVGGAGSTPAPTPRATPALEATPSLRPSDSSEPSPSTSGTTAGSPGGTPVLTVARGGNGGLDRVPVDLGINGLGADWFIPVAAVAGPGLLVMVAIALQLAGALAWLPAVRRYLGSETRRPRSPR